MLVPKSFSFKKDETEYSGNFLSFRPSPVLFVLFMVCVHSVKGEEDGHRVYS